MRELQYTVAQAFKMRGKEELTTREFVFVLSFDLKWFSPEEARRILYMAKKNNLVDIEGDKVLPKFRISSVQIPFGFKPSEEIWRERSLLDRIKERIASSSNMSNEEIEKMIKEKMEEFHNLIYPEVAGLLVARKYSEISDLKEELIDSLFSRDGRVSQEMRSAE
ncbi:MAG: hypothetical protein PWR13_728 [Archaeoglobi archaeon]|nr:hypothetical protein [Archaeoglobi archaeon]MDK2781700.1 hypothetical protein [Archaeoglobi archaeon]